MNQLFFLIFIQFIKQVFLQTDDTAGPFLKFQKKDGILVATLKNNDFTSYMFQDFQDDIGLVNESFSYQQYGIQIIEMMPAQNIQKITFNFNKSCKVPMVYSVVQNDQNPFEIINETKIEMYYDQLGQNELESASVGFERLLKNIQDNYNFVEAFSQQEIQYDIRETSRQIVAICLVFDVYEEYNFQFKADLEEYKIERQQQNFTMGPNETQDIDLSIPPQTSYEVTVNTEANELKLTFNYNSPDFEYQVVQIKQDKNIEYKQQAFIQVVGIASQDKIKVLMMNVGYEDIEVNILAETFVINDNKFPVWAIVLICVAGTIILAVVIVIIVFYLKKKSKQSNKSDYPDEPPELQKEKAKMVEKLPQETKVVDPNMIGSRIHYPEFNEEDQTNIDVFTIKLKEEEMNLDYPSNIIKDNEKHNQFQISLYNLILKNIDYCQINIFWKLL